jgi:glycerol-1-phosphate dehydrogenase [NAD(P)+]
MPSASVHSSGGSKPPLATGGSQRLAAALALARDTKALCLGSGAILHTAAVFSAQFPGKRAHLVADSTTYAVAGRRVQAILSAAGLSGREPIILPAASLAAEYSWIEQLVGCLRTHDLIPVAVGSGTINDLVKLASHLTGRTYLCVGTAASMDGYNAYGASITRHGAKQTFNCPAPKAVIADSDILRAAPSALTASGYADLQAKITAGADWILADELGVEPIAPQAWHLVQDGLRAALADPAGARAGDPAAVTALTDGLMLVGFAMQGLQSSRPASGAEHQFSHLWDMEHLTYEGASPSHGFKVGVATLAVASLYEALLHQPLDRIDIDDCCARWPDWSEIARQIHTLFGDADFITTPLTETQAKHPSREVLHAQLTRLQTHWPALRARLQAQLLPTTELRRRLQLVGAPVTLEAIGLTRERLRWSFRRAYHIRRRFTVLDLAVRTAQLENCLDELFAPGGCWSDQP